MPGPGTGTEQLSVSLAMSWGRPVDKQKQQWHLQGISGPEQCQCCQSNGLRTVSTFPSRGRVYSSPLAFSGGEYGVQTPIATVRLHITKARLTFFEVFNKALSASLRSCTHS